MAAGEIIVIEPIPERREIAMRFGATSVIDPNDDPDSVVEQVRALCDGPSDRIDAGGRHARGFFQLPLRQSWQVTRGGGFLHLLSANQYEEISFPSTEFCLSTRTIYGGQMAGQHVLRDNPRIIAMMERGHVDAGPIITARYGLDGIIEGFRGVAERTQLGVIFVP